MSTVNTTSSVHPCYSKEAAKKYSRLHLPVAPGCNIQCGYCSRKTDCPNESRPGVSSKVLNPEQAEFYAMNMLALDPSISIIGIAGPGDAFNDPERTIETLTRIHRRNEKIQFCVSTNGLNLYPYVDSLAELGLTHLTVTVNAVDPVIGAEIYRWIRYEKRRYLGMEGAALLLERQKEGIIRAVTKGITLKVNTVYLPGINDFHIQEVAETVKDWGADTQNIIPFLPVEDSAFEALPPPDHAQVVRMRMALDPVIHQMTHCGRCRADAAGKIGAKNSDEADRILSEASSYKEIRKPATRRYAAASKEGILVNCHLGEASAFHVFRMTGNGLVFEQERPAPASGEGRWQQLCALLKDCDALFVSGAGPSPAKVFQNEGCELHICEGLIEEIIETYEDSGNLAAYRPCDQFACGSGCGGSGTGCA
ncbi:MAG: radical SAM protein [Spirochaetales bacterium]|nr:radical SAM protein [Spirochaetales bacterium]